MDDNDRINLLVCDADLGLKYLLIFVIICAWLTLDMDRKIFS